MTKEQLQRKNDDLITALDISRELFIEAKAKYIKEIKSLVRELYFNDAIYLLEKTSISPDIIIKAKLEEGIPLTEMESKYLSTKL